jgi:hypothetical protein
MCSTVRLRCRVFGRSVEFRPSHGQSGSNLGRPDSRYYFRLADHPKPFQARSTIRRLLNAGW